MQVDSSQDRLAQKRRFGFFTPLILYTIKADTDEETLSRSQWISATKEVNDLANSLFPNMWAWFSSSRIIKIERNQQGIKSKNVLMFSYIIMGEIYGGTEGMNESIDIKNCKYYFVNYFPNKVLNIENMGSN